MANVKITDLPQINFSSITNNDVIPIVDVNSNTTSKVLISDLKTFFSTPFTGGTISGNTIFQNGLTANTISATTYQNLPLDVFVTGGTYSNGVTTFTNNIGGTFSVSGYFTGQTEVFVTGFTYSNNQLTISQNSGTSLSVTINNMTGLTVNGTLSATTISGGTFYGNGSNLTNLPSEWTEIVVDITDVNAIRNCGTIPIEILPAPGVGKYYEYEGVAEYTYNTTNYDFNDMVGILGESSYAGVYILPSSILFIGDRIMQFNSKMPIYVDILRTDTVYQQPAVTNERLVLSTWSASNNATVGDGTFKIKLKYKIVTFG